MRKTSMAVILCLLVSACVTSGTQARPGATEPTAVIAAEPAAVASPPTLPTTTAESTTTKAPTTTTTTIPTFALTGQVLDADGFPLAEAFVEIAGDSVLTDAEGRFDLGERTVGTVSVAKPAWLPVEVDWDGGPSIDIELEPRIVRGLRVAKYVAMEPDQFEELLDLAERTIINTLIFDTKDESGYVLYETGVEKVAELDALDVHYDAVQMIAETHERGLYAMTRIVTFEDRVWVRNDPDAKLIGEWVDPTNEANWEYPLALGVEACELGFDEIQFDYVRFPAGLTGAAFNARATIDQEGRVGVIQAFLAEARRRLHPMGCGVSAAVFGIVMSSPTDEGIGQRPEELSAQVDAVSPMIYPSHYSDGWLGFSNPNNHPGPVTADALDDGAPRLADTALLRPWLQAFYYNGSQVQAGIMEAELRGHGWLLWNAGGNYAESWIPAAEDLPVTEEADDEPAGDEPADGVVDDGDDGEA